MNKQNCTSLIITCLFSRIRSLKKLITVFTYLLPETRLLVTPAIEAQLNERQKEILKRVVETGSMTTGWCMETLNISRDTAHRNLVDLAKSDILVSQGSGRGVIYVLRENISDSEIIR